MEGSEAQEAFAQLEEGAVPVAVPNMLEAPPQELTLMDGEEENEGGEGEDNKNRGVGEEAAEEGYDPLKVLELGDHVIIDSKKYGRTVGTIYYRSGDLIRVMPDGAQNILYDFERIYTDDEDRFADELGVTDAFILDKRKFDTFVELNDIRVDQTLESIEKNGEPGPVFVVETVNPEDDEIIVKNKETGETETLSFGYVGIDTDLPFVILRKAILTAEEAEAAEKEKQAAKGEREGQEGEEGEEGFIPPEEAEEVLDVPEFIAVPSGKIILPKPTIYKEAKTADKIYTDTDQKIDALNDFISMLDPLAQKDQKEIRNQRLLVETMFQMKQQLTALNPDGTVKGPEAVSVETIAQLLDKVDVPLGRAVLDITKRIYSRESDTNEDDSESPDDYYTVNFVSEIEQMKTADTTEMPGAGPSSTIKKFWFNQQAFADNYARPWKPNSVVPPNLIPKSDVEVFRRYIPDLNEAQIPGGFEITDPYNGKLEDNYPLMTNIKMSTTRALGPTYRKGEDKRKQMLISSESGSLKSYLLFPMETAHQIGTTRSGSLAVDSGRNLYPLKTLIDLFTDLGGIEDVPTSKNIIALEVAGKTLGNIPLKDYIEGLRLTGTGIGDTTTSLVELGLDKLELTPEILATIDSKLKAYQDQLITTIATLRDELKDAVGDELTPVVNTSYLEPNPILETVIRTQPILVEDLVTFEKQNPVIAKSDIAQFVYLLRKHADYFQTAAGQQPVYTAREKLRATRDMFLESLQISELLRQKREDRGEKPEPNLCPHVAQLRTIRKVRDETERYAVLTKFLVKYQGSREENWIMCNTCNKELLCVHERNQIQAFLSPKEKDQLQKEMFIHFSDGVFNGHFICRNCGQPMLELGYDTHMEYDDDGRPMSGTAVLEDVDKLKRAEIDAVLGIPTESPEEEILFDSIAEKSYYIVVKEIASRIGVNLDEKSFRRIIYHIDKHMKGLPTRKEYTSAVKKGGAKEDYDVMISRIKVSASALFLLIEIQTRIPDFVVRYALPGCVASFSGYPLGAEQDRRGLTYLACAVASITRNEEPWTTSGFMSVKSEEKRRNYVLNYMNGILEEALKEDMTLHQIIQEKRAYIKRMLGTDVTHDIPKDEIPFGFLPEQLMVKPTDEPIIPEVAANMNTIAAQIAVARAWILQGHHLATKTANLIKGSPYIETTCCLTNIQAPGSFWTSASNMPKLPPRQLTPKLLLQSILKVHFDPRKREILLAETPDDILYRIFLKVCFQGPRKGLPHEPGLTHLCPWCGFQFPGHPKYIDMEKEGETALVSQEVKTGRDEFQSLLDDVHKANAVPKFEEHTIISTEDALKALSEMEYPPMEGWKEIIMETLGGLKELAPDANRGDVLTAVGQLSDRIRDARESIEARLPAKAVQNLSKVGELSWTNFFQLIQAYMIVPIQRMLNGMGYGTKLVPKELELSTDHVDMIKEKIFGQDDKIVVPFMAELKKPTNAFGRAKLKKYIAQMSAAMEFKSKIRAIMVRGGASTLNFIQRAFLYGPLQTLFDPHDIPEEYAETAAELGAGDASADTSIRVLLNLVSVSVTKAMAERLTFSDEELKNLIAARDEKERKKVLSDFDSMTEDEREAEMTQKFLGIGRFAAGGTKVIYAYDKEWFDYETKMRKDAGIIDFQDSTPTEFMGFVQDGPAVDMYGLPMGGGQEDDRYRSDYGYDNRQFGDDD